MPGHSRADGDADAANSSDDEQQFFADLLGKQNLRAGVKVVQHTVKDKKGKSKEAVVGGGSFQSLGRCRVGDIWKSLLR